MRKISCIRLTILLGCLVSMQVQAGDIEITMGGQVNSLHVGAVFLTGTADGIPEASNNSTDTNDDIITTSTGAGTAGAWAIDVVSAGDGGGFTTNTVGQVERWDESTGGGGATGAMSTKPLAAAAADSMSWDFGPNVNRLAHSVARVAPAPSEAIAFDSVSSNLDINPTSTLWTHTFGLGGAGKLIVGISIEDDGCNGPEIVSSVTHDGNPLTFITAITQGTGFCNRTELWYIDLDIPVANLVEVTMTGQVSELMAGVVAITGATAGDPEVSATNSNTNSQSITTNISPLTNNAWLIDGVSAGDPGSFNFTAGQDERWEESTDQATGSSSTKSLGAAGPNSMTRTHSDGNPRRLAHAVMSVAPDGTIAFDSATSANDGDVAALSFAHSLVTPGNAKIIVAVALEGNGTQCGSGNVNVTGVNYAGQPMTFVTGITQVDGFCNRIELWYLDYIVVDTADVDAYYQMDETWTVPAADTVLDYSGNSNHANTIASGTATNISNNNVTAAIAGSPGTCGYGVFPLNNNDANQHAVDTRLIPGDTGSISFWYSNDTDWDIDAGSGGRKLLDASSSASSRFYLQTNGNNGQLIFRIDDGGGNQAQAITADQTFLADEWVHIAITWDMPNNQLEVYLNGVLSATGTTTDTTAAAWNSLYIGDNRLVGVAGDGTGRSAGGRIDEVRIYDDVIDQTQVDTDRTATHPCTNVNHYKIEVVTSSPNICFPLEIKITAHDILDGPVNVLGNIDLDISTFTGDGIWSASLISGSGTWTPSGADDGNATYTWPATEDESSFTIGLSQGSAVTQNINLVDDNGVTELIGNAFEDPDIEFSDEPYIRLTTDGTDEAALDTQIAAKDSDVGYGAQTLYMQLKNSGITFFGSDACEVPPDYSGDLPADRFFMAAECIDPAVCNGNVVSVQDRNGVMQPILTYDTASFPDFLPNTGNWTAVLINFDGNGFFDTDDNKASLVVNYPDAGLIKIHFIVDRYNPPGFPPTTPERTFEGESNIFAVRPFGFRVDDFSPANPAATDGTGGVFAKAGEDFSADISAVAWEAADDDGSAGGVADDGIPDTNADLAGNSVTPNFGNEFTPATANIVHSLVAPVGGQTGTLTGGGNVSSFTNGVLDDYTMSWDEVGVIQFDVAMLNNEYLGSGEDVTGQVPYVGRFTPARLDVAKQGSQEEFGNACDTGGFTYQDQTFYYGPANNDAPRLRIRGLSSAGDITFNYDSSDFFKLDATTLPRNYTDLSAAAATFEPPIIDTDVQTLNLGNFNGNIVLRLDNDIDGDVFMYSKNATEAPFAANANLVFEGGGLTDSDGICFDNDGDSSCDTNDADTPDDFDFGSITGTEIRFGRLNIGTAVGSELLPISLAFQAEYFDGSNFIVNTDDDCTSIAVTDLVLDSGNEVLQTDGNIDITDAGSCGGSGLVTATMVNDPFLAGDGGLSFVMAVPAAGCIGYIDISLDLAPLLLDHLQYDWNDVDGNEDGPFDANPQGRIDFGQFEGRKEYIYIREPW